MTAELSQIMKLKRSLEEVSRCETPNTAEIVDILQVLQTCNLTLDLLQKSGIGITVNRIRKEVNEDQVSSLVKKLIKSWKRFLLTDASSESSSPKPTTPTKRSVPGKSKKSRPVIRPVVRPVVLPNTPSSISSPLSSTPSRSTPPSTSRLSPPPAHSSTSFPTNLSCGSPNTRLANGLASAPDSHPYGEPSTGISLNFPASISGHECTPSTGADIRDRCRELLVAALKKDCEQVTTEEEYKFYNLSSQIEECVFGSLGDTGSKYKQRVRSRVSNLSDAKNLALRQRVISGQISPAEIANMPTEEMASDSMKELRQRLTEEAIRDAQVAQMDGAGGTECDLIRCPECGKNKCTYTQAQTLCADEPMTTFAYCNDCGNRWIFY